MRGIGGEDIGIAFRAAETGSGFVSRYMRGPVPCPAALIVAVAGLQIKDGTEAVLPDGYNEKTLRDKEWDFGIVGEDVPITRELGVDLANIGGEVLELD